MVFNSLMLGHGSALSTLLRPSQLIFREKSTTIVDKPCEIIPLPMKQRQTLAEYVNQVMIDNGEKPKDVEARSRRARDPISDSAIGKILLDQTKNPGILTLRALARGLGRPIEEVVAAALGDLPVESLGFKQSEVADFWVVLDRLPAAEQKFYKRCLQMLKRDMLKH